MLYTMYKNMCNINTTYIYKKNYNNYRVDISRILDLDNLFSSE